MHLSKSFAIVRQLRATHVLGSILVALFGAVLWSQAGPIARQNNYRDWQHDLVTAQRHFEPHHGTITDLSSNYSSPIIGSPIAYKLTVTDEHGATHQWSVPNNGPLPTPGQKLAYWEFDPGSTLTSPTGFNLFIPSHTGERPWDSFSTEARWLKLHRGSDTGTEFINGMVKRWPGWCLWIIILSWGGNVMRLITKLQDKKPQGESLLETSKEWSTHDENLVRDATILRRAAAQANLPVENFEKWLAMETPTDVPNE